MGNNYLIHYRTPGSKNGERRYQNEDGTWTPLGLERRRAEYKSVLDEQKKGRIVRGAVSALGTAASVAGMYGGYRAATGRTQGVTVDNPLLKQKPKNKEEEKLLKNEKAKIVMKYDPETGKPIYTDNYGKAFAPGKDGKPSLIEKVFNSSKDITNETSRISDSLKSNKKNKFNVNDLSNKELENMIRRMDLEKRYSQMRSEDMSQGRDRVDKWMGVVGGLAAIGASAATIMSVISQIKGTK